MQDEWDELDDSAFGAIIAAAAWQTVAFAGQASVPLLLLLTAEAWVTMRYAVSAPLRSDAHRIIGNFFPARIAGLLFISTWVMLYFAGALSLDWTLVFHLQLSLAAAGAGAFLCACGAIVWRKESKSLVPLLNELIPLAWYL